jgi:hypothetical protein
LELHKYFRLSADIDVAAFGNQIDDLWPILSKINNLTGNSKFTDDLVNLFSGVVAIRGEVPLLKEGFKDIPRGLTTSAALSRIYSGMRGVVSWRYLASEQIIRDHQRRKGLMLHAILTDPNFVRQLSVLIEGNRLNAKETAAFAKKLAEVAGPKFVVYNQDTEKMDYDPDASAIWTAFQNIMIGPKKIGKVSLDWKAKKQEREILEKQEEESMYFLGEPGEQKGYGLFKQGYFDDEEEEKKKGIEPTEEDVFDPDYFKMLQ